MIKIIIICTISDSFLVPDVYTSMHTDQDKQLVVFSGGYVVTIYSYSTTQPIFCRQLDKGSA